MGVEKYGMSTYGKIILVDEGIKEYSTTRNIFIWANVFMLVGATIVVIQQYLAHRKSLFQTQRRKGTSTTNVNGASSTVTPFFIAFMVNNLIRGAHMIDHISRPVYYHEPKWAYQKYWIVEMEIPTYANVIITGLGLLAILKVMNAITGGAKSIVPSLIYMTLFIPASAFNLVHYTLEPPSNYGPFPNFNIAGSGITTIPLAFLIIYAYKTYQPSGRTSNRNSRRGETESTEELLKSNDDDRRRSTRNAQTRRRSKTPVKK